MPVGSIAFTRTVKRQWEEYWADRPNDTPPSLLAVLEESEAVTDFAGLDFEPRADAELWVHPDLPDHTFVVSVTPVECVVTALLRRRRTRAKDLLVPKPAADRPARKSEAWEPYPAEAPLAEREAWVAGQMAVAQIQMESSGPRNPLRQAAMLRIAELKTLRGDIRREKVAADLTKARTGKPDYQKGLDKEYGETMAWLCRKRAAATDPAVRAAIEEMIAEYKLRDYYQKGGG